MTRDDIIRLAQTAKLYSGKPRTTATGRMIERRLKHFAELVAAAEREACAKVADAWDADHPETNYGRCIAAAIRARG